MATGGFILGWCFLFATLMVFSAKAHTKNCALIVAGGGEEKFRQTNQFEPIARNYISALGSRGWAVDALWDKQNWPEQKPHKDALDLSRGNIEKKLGSLLQGKCDQVLIVGLNHGSPGATHGWAMPNGEWLDLSALKNVLATRKKGVKVGLIDHSCYSGNAVEQMGSGIDCVVTSSGRKSPTSGGYVESMAAYLASLKPTEKLSLHDYWVKTLCKNGSLSHMENTDLSLHSACDSLKPVPDCIVNAMKGMSSAQIDSFFALLQKETSCSLDDLKNGWKALLERKPARWYFEDAGASVIQSYLSRKDSGAKGKCDDFSL